MFILDLISLPNLRIKEPASQNLYSTTAVDGRQSEKPYNITTIESYQLGEGTEAFRHRFGPDQASPTKGASEPVAYLA